MGFGVDRDRIAQLDCAVLADRGDGKARMGSANINRDDICACAAQT